MITIDLRSDTFTLPDAGMRQAIHTAEVGNSGYGEDPAVNRLEAAMAEYFGVDAGVFLPSATMAGQIAIRVWSRPGDLVLIEEFGHNYYFETGSMAAIAGAQARLLQGERGIVPPQAVENACNQLANQHAHTSLIVLENTSNFGGGTIYPQQTLDAIFSIAAKRSLPVHIDGARIWNAIVASGCDPQRQIQPGGSLSVCFSKGLGAPMGAVLLGPGEFIKEARRIQTMLGGVMRQVGFMAAAALYGFHHNLQRLAEDHAHCLSMAQRLAGHPELEIDLASVQTNILYCKVKAGPESAAGLVEQLAEQGIGALALGSLLRLVTSLNVSAKDCERAAEVLDRLLRD